MESRKMKLLAKGTAMAPDLEAMQAGVKRFIGRKLDRTLGYASRDENGNILMSGGWPPNSEPEEKVLRSEYMGHVRDGDLWAADEWTAQVCGVAFDPDFGGEYDSE